MAKEVWRPDPPSAPLQEDPGFASALGAIRDAQNRDHGWGYQEGASWTEPTAYALLALAAAGETSEQFERGLSYLEAAQRQDGGWPPHPSVKQSTWVTALAALVLPGGKRTNGLSAAGQWLLRQSGRESGSLQRFKDWLLGGHAEEDLRYAGWAWFPGTAAWVTPTSWTILALRKAGAHHRAPASNRRIVAGYNFLLSRMCADGGWNQGSTRALGYDANSYPETTGLALVALSGWKGGSLEKSVNCAARHLESCRTVEGRAWLDLGLRAQGRQPASPSSPTPPFRSLMDRAVYVIAKAAQNGRNVLVGTP